jgi:hypothetical protein
MRKPRRVVLELQPDDYRVLESSAMGSAAAGPPQRSGSDGRADQRGTRLGKRAWTRYDPLEWHHLRRGGRK